MHIQFSRKLMMEYIYLGGILLDEQEIFGPYSVDE